MPNPDWSCFVLSALIPAAQIGLLVWIIRRGIWRLWVALCTILAVSALGRILTFLLLLLDFLTHRQSELIPTVFFYEFWYSALLVAALQVWLLWEVVSRITGCADRPWLRCGFTLLTAVSAVGAFYVSSHAAMPEFTYPVMRAVTVIDRTLWLTWCLLFVGLTVSVDIVGLKWRRQIIGITLGFVLQAVAGTFYSWLLSANTVSALDTFTSVAWLLSVIVWALALREPLLLLLTPALEAAFENSIRQLETTHKGVNRPCL